MRFATCNEPWRDVPIEAVFRKAAEIGYAGVEIAPFTIADDVREISASRRREIARAADEAGIAIVGLHWLFVSPKGLHLTTPDESVRRRSAEYLKALADFCADLDAKVMTFGSPKQRSIEPPTTFDEGWKRARDVFAECAPQCAARGVTLCIEALSPKETNFINTVEQAARLADEVGQAGIDVMLDIKAMSSMPTGIIETIQRFGRRAKHFHVNEPSGKGVGMPAGPGESNLDLRPILKALAQSGYDGWVSVEPFDYTPDPDTVAKVELATMKSAI
jgi:sugar phosphate isomerase/epimerase